MRTYATFIAKDKDAVIDSIISGKRINKEKDVNDNLLTDYYLKNAISKIYPNFNQVYDNASGYIHLSEKSFYQTIESCENNTIKFYIGPNLLEKHNPYLI